MSEETSLPYLVLLVCWSRWRSEESISLQNIVFALHSSRRTGRPRSLALTIPFGLTNQLKSVAGRYASLACEVVIPALYGRHQKDVVIPFSEASRGRDMMPASSLEKTMLEVDVAVKSLVAKGENVGVIGVCWGAGLISAPLKFLISRRLSHSTVRGCQLIRSRC